MLEWIVIGAIGLAVGDGLLKGFKEKKPSLPPAAPKPGPSAQELEAERERQRAAWDALFAARFDQAGWIPSGVAKRFIDQHPRPRDATSGLLAIARSAKALQEGRPDPHGPMRKFEVHNQGVLARHKVELQSFFDTVETSPLTDEQIHACVCMDDNVMLVAAAGSGKTSTMVAKTGYVLRQALASPDQILLLAFNRNAADELGQRIGQRLADVPGVDKVTAKTFDAFGLSVIGKATGKKPSLAPWLEHKGQDVAAVVDIAQALGAEDQAFRRDWDLFRTVYARDVGVVGERADPEAFDGKQRGFRTADGKVVKSKEEQLICNWLFFNGVAYVYERPYEHETASEDRRQYQPDFYYPDIGLYHEHFALDDHGQAPAHFDGDYVAGVHWKRALHAEKGTELFETTSAEIRSNHALQRLEEALVSRGVTQSFDANRETVGPPPMSDKQLASTLRVFQQHVKNNRLSQAELEQAARAQGLQGHGYRSQLFLKIYERVSSEWERRLRDGGYIDFEDMLRLAAEHIEAGRYHSRFKVILADEFQDSSRARARLLQALTKADDTHLTVVGDDWQGINRFAGADLRVMSEFGAFFSPSTSLQLTTTFRSPQALCDISSEFVQANPKQLKKTVRTTNVFENRPLQAFGFKDLGKTEDHVEQQLSQMVSLLDQGKLQSGRGGRTRVLFLGRYKSDQPDRLKRWERRFSAHLDIDFKTVHASKGLEAEYVYVLGVVEDRRGFPSQIEDDPVLQLAMPEAETFAMAEERRLFYVALTRASRQVRLYTSLEKPSRFVAELVSRKQLEVEAVEGEALETCPQCQAGVLKLRTSGRSPFHGCSRYPQCDFTRSVKEGETVETPVVRLAYAMPLESDCPTCGTGKMRLSKGKHGRFLGCSAFPECKTTAPVG
ncbi:DNA helicase-4 [Brevundimonas vesicularis]|uniref:DNA 3'-5' helicase n=1 Tax=Brevundimonas vesicularis TaxID=41276 RepID=A0A7W9FV72_BREVE|nr:UvrD-helicase domain-containing protein [Brevundimonas vesicularis]MBB5772111.1 DNA helicase-4 [Brevundimonas vesicularis]